MKALKILPFFILVILLFSFGCTNHKTNNSAKSVPVNQVGIISYQYKINGENSTVIHLLKGEQAQLGIKLTNHGLHTIQNVDLKLISCISPSSSNVMIYNLSSGQTGYYSFTLLNNLSLSSQEVRCPSTVRVFFGYETNSYHDIAILGKDYNNEPPKSISYTDHDLVSVSYQLPTSFRVLNDKIISGRIVIRNIGDGFIDYPTLGYSNEIKEIDIKLPNDLQLYSVAGYTPNSKDNGINVTILHGQDYATYIIRADNLTMAQRSIITKMAIGAGNLGTIYLPIKLKYVGHISDTGSEVDRIFVTLHYGYSYDLLKFTLILGSNY